MARKDDFEERRLHLKGMDDEALFDYFWELAGKVVSPTQIGRASCRERV